MTFDTICTNLKIQYYVMLAYEPHVSEFILDIRNVTAVGSWVRTICICEWHDVLRYCSSDRYTIKLMGLFTAQSGRDF